jgi:cytochrome c6
VGRTALIAAVLLGASTLAACQSRGVASPTPAKVIGTVATNPTTTFPIVPAFHLTGIPAHGRPLFITNCGSCHVLADAGTSGNPALGAPNLDDLKPDYQTVTAQVTNGGGAMPSFNHTLSTQKIADVAAYVVTATGGSLP